MLVENKLTNVLNLELVLLEDLDTEDSEWAENEIDLSKDKFNYTL